MLEKHSTITPIEGTPTRSEPDQSEQVIQVFESLEPKARMVALALLDGLDTHNSAQIKLALDWGIELYGSNETTLGFYHTFGIVPYVLEVQP